MSVTINLSPFNKVIREIIQNSIEQNFEEQGRYGNGILGGGQTHWEKSRRAIKQQGETLQDSGQLAASVRVKVSGGGTIELLDGEEKFDMNLNGNGFEIEMGSNKPYASIHQFGGEIKKEARESSAKWKAKKTASGNYQFRFAKKSSKAKNTISRGFRIGAHSILMPARPYLVVQQEDLNLISMKFLEFLATRV